MWSDAHQLVQGRHEGTNRLKLGTSGHARKFVGGSGPGGGVNSFLHMLKVAAPLESYAQRMSGRHTAYPVGHGEALGNMVVIGGQSGGGSNFNVVPARTSFTIDGLNPEENIDTGVERITDTVNNAARDAGADVSIHITQVAPPAGTPLTDPTAQLLGDRVTAVTGSPARYELCAGWPGHPLVLPARHPAFGYGPGRFDVSHGPDEYVEEAALSRVAAVYALFASELTR